jgi:hypothetical protein
MIRPAGDISITKGETMKLQNKMLVSIATFFLFIAPSFAQQVKTDYDHNANFGHYKTYSWGSVKTQDPLLVDRIKDAVNAALAAKGWTQVDSGGDVSVVAMEITRNQQTLNTFYDGFGGGWRWREDSEDSEMQRQPLKPTRSAPWSSICSTPTART